jgi:subtilisin family serine protease
MKSAAVLVAALAAFVVAQAAPARSQLAPATWPAKTVVVGYASDQALADALRGGSATLVRAIPGLRAAELRPHRDAAAFAAALVGLDGIDYVQPPAARHAFVEPALAPAAVQGGAYQWQYGVTHADRVDAGAARAAASTAIAIVDSGLDLTAPDIAAKAPRTYNAMDGSRNVVDTVGHGTFVASLAAGSVTNGEGIAGMGGDARLIGVKAGEGDLSDFDVAAAITYAVDQGARVINLSIGGRTSSVTEFRALQYAAAKDVLLVAAAGNEFHEGNPVEYPAAHLQPVGSNGVGGIGLVVGASRIDGTRASFSNTGSHISLAAPGENVFGAISKDSSPRDFPRVRLPGSASGFYGYSSGTSFASPQVAGAAALVWGANRYLNARQVADILKSTASGHGAWNGELGYGVIDVAAAVALAKSTPAVALTANTSPNGAWLTWAATPEAKSFRLLDRVGKKADAALLNVTPATSYRFEKKENRTHVFTVEALDAAGNVVARSASLTVTIGRAKSKLSLRNMRFTYQGRHYSILMAVLAPQAVDVRAGARMVKAEELGPYGWRLVGFGMTDSAGRVMWTVPPGTHRYRATFAASYDLAAAKTKGIWARG